MAVCMRAFDCTPVGKHVHSGEGVRGSNASSSKCLPKGCAARWRLLKNAPSKGHHTRYITPFLEGNYSVINFSEEMKMSYAGFRHFLRQFQGNLSLFLGPTSLIN